MTNVRGFKFFGSFGKPLRSYCMQPAIELVPVDPLQLLAACRLARQQRRPSRLINRWAEICE